MARGWKIAAVVIGGLIALLTLNAVIVNGQTRSAEPRDGGELLPLADATLNVRVEGPEDGPPLVLLHGSLGSMSWWDEVAPELAEDHRVIRIDLLGHGGSEAPDRDYTVDDNARLVALALGELDVEAAVVVGHSMGGGVAVRLAERSSELVDRIALIGTSPDTGFGSLPLAARLYSVPGLGQAMSRFRFDAGIRSGLGSAFADGFEVPDRFVEDFKQVTYPANVRTRRGWEDYIEAVPLDRRLLELGLPVLVVWGSEDEIASRAALERYEEVPGARTVEMPAAGHSPMVELPEETVEELRGFAAGRRGG